MPRVRTVPKAVAEIHRHAPRSASGDGRCSYIPAPSRALYGLVARLTRCAYLMLPENGHRNREYFTPPPIRGGGEYSHVLIIMLCRADVNPGAEAVRNPKAYSDLLTSSTQQGSGSSGPGKFSPCRVIYA